jgi:hypothetical protein
MSNATENEANVRAKLKGRLDKIKGRLLYVKVFNKSTVKCYFTLNNQFTGDDSGIEWQKWAK